MTGWASTRGRTDVHGYRAQCTRAGTWTTSTPALRAPKTVGRNTTPTDPGEAVTRTPAAVRTPTIHPVGDVVRRAAWRLRRWLRG